MAIELADAYVSIVPSTRGLKQQLDRELTGQMATAGRASGQQFAGGFGVSMKQIGVLAAAGAVGAFATQAVQVASANEQAAVSFELLLGSAQEAAAFMEELKAFEARTPFDLPSLQTAASRLLAVGTEAERVIPIMEAIGDATAGMGTGAEGINRAVTALTQMQQKGKVTAEEMLQLTEAGLPAWDALASVLGTDVSGAMAAVEARTVSASTMFEALENRAGPAMERLAGLMEKQSLTLQGMFSTFKSTFEQTLGRLAAPAMPMLKEGLGELTTLLDTAEPALSAFADAWTAGASPALEAGSGYLNNLAREVVPKLIPLIEEMGEMAADNADSFVEMLESAEPMIPVIGDLVEASEPLVEIWSALETMKADLAFEAVGAAAQLAAGQLNLVAQGLDAITFWSDDQPDMGQGFVDIAKGAAEAEPEVRKLRRAVDDTAQSFEDGLKAWKATVDEQFDLADAVRSSETALTDYAAAQELAAGRGEEWADATERITDAQDGVRNATRNAADALAAVADAERDIRDAQRDAAQAQTDLNRAREDAVERLEDLRRAQAGNAIGVREAEMAVAQAQEDYDLAIDDPSTLSVDEREQALLRLQRAELALEEALDRAADGQRELTDAERAGVEGSPEVIAAKDAIEQANRRVEEANDALVAAQERVEEANARVVEAEKAVGEAILERQKIQDEAAKRLPELADAAIEAVATVAHAVSLITGNVQGGIDTLMELLSRLDPNSPLFDRITDLVGDLQGIRVASSGGAPGFVMPPAPTSVDRPRGRSGGVPLIGSAVIYTADGEKIRRETRRAVTPR